MLTFYNIIVRKLVAVTSASKGENSSNKDKALSEKLCFTSSCYLLLLFVVNLDSLF